MKTKTIKYLICIMILLMQISFASNAATTVGMAPGEEAFTISVDDSPGQEELLVVDESLVENPISEKSYTDEDLQYMIMVLTGECQNRSIEIQKKYGSVVLNRVNHSNYPNSIKEVCLQRHQYSCFSDGNAYRTPTADTIEAATWLLENGSVYPSNVIYQSRCKQGKGIYEIIQGEYFCY